jgi:methionine-rich copper-binding protein CopC
MSITPLLRRHPRRRIGAVAAAGAFALGVGSASAHTEISSTSPGKGKTAKTTITAVAITFSGTVRRGAITVTGPTRNVVSAGFGGRDPRNPKRVLVPLKRGLKPGQYKVSWRINAADGHFQSGTYTFRLVKS